MHVTLRAGLGPLRSQFLFPTVRLALRRATSRNPEKFRIVHFSVQRDHLHLIVEASDRRALSAGMRGLMVRVARYVNQLLLRKGRLWADRWHGRALTTPKSMRNALRYVLANFRKHERCLPRDAIDPFSSAAWFDGWRNAAPRGHSEPPPAPGRAPPFGFSGRAMSGGSESSLGRDESRPVAPARSWLGSLGWRRAGLIGVGEQPSGGVSP